MCTRAHTCPPRTARPLLRWRRGTPGAHLYAEQQRGRGLQAVAPAPPAQRQVDSHETEIVDWCWGSVDVDRALRVARERPIPGVGKRQPRAPNGIWHVSESGTREPSAGRVGGTDRVTGAAGAGTRHRATKCAAAHNPDPNPGPASDQRGPSQGPEAAERDETKSPWLAPGIARVELCGCARGGAAVGGRVHLGPSGW